MGFVSPEDLGNYQFVLTAVGGIAGACLTLYFGGSSYETINNRKKYEIEEYEHFSDEVEIPPHDYPYNSEQELG